MCCGNPTNRDSYVGLSLCEIAAGSTRVSSPRNDIVFTLISEQLRVHAGIVKNILLGDTGITAEIGG